MLLNIFWVNFQRELCISNVNVFGDVMLFYNFLIRVYFDRACNDVISN